MGLRLYTPPVESDVRTKNTTPAAQNTNRIRRTGRRSNDALREIRRRAILTEAMSQAVSTARTDLDREQWESRHLSRMRLEQQARTLETGPAQQLAMINARREPMREHPVHREPEEIMDIMQRHQERARMLLNQELNSTTNPVYEESIHRFLANIREPDQSPFPSANRSAANASRAPSAAARPRNTSVPVPPPTLSPTDPRSQYLGMTRPRGPSTDEIAPTPSYGQSIASTDQPTASEHYSNTFVGALNQELAQAAGRPAHRWATEGPFPIDEPEQSPRPTMDHFMGFDESEEFPLLPRLTGRRPPSLRRVPLPGNPARRPTVGWSDTANPTAPTGTQPSSSATSRIFGDVNQIRSGPEAASARQYGWAVRYIDGNSVNNPLPSIHDLLGNNQADGLGDRRRSLSPEGDGAWDTLLTTLTPDPQPPSMGSSFASTSEALAAAASQEQASSSQPTVVPTLNLSAPPAVPSPTARHGHEDEDELDSPFGTTAASRARRGAAIMASLRASNSASPAAGSSGRTSATASQRIRSPFTSVSAGTSTGDESAVLGGVGLEEDDGCDDMDMDPRREDYDVDEDEEDEEEQADFLGLSSQPSLAQIGYLRANASRQRLAEEQMRLHNGLRRQILRERSVNRVPQRDQSGGPGPQQTEEALDSLGIGGMQHIVRSLARREDIPDEWWAEAGLSRTLRREESN